MSHILILTFACAFASGAFTAMAISQARRRMALHRDAKGRFARKDA